MPATVGTAPSGPTSAAMATAPGGTTASTDGAIASTDAATASTDTTAVEQVTLEFEEIPGVGPTTHGMHLHEQYADPDTSYGVTFVPPEETDYGAEVVECGRDYRCDDAHSGDMVAATPGPGSSCDVCTKYPMTVRFARLQKAVSLRVTHEGTDADFTAVATLTARDADGNQIDTERVTFPSDGGWQELSVGNPFGSARIAEVTVAGGKEGTTPYWNTILVDDLTFEAEPPDATADTDPPFLTASSAYDGGTVGYATAGSGVDVRFLARDDRQLANVSYRVAGGPVHLLCGSHGTLTQGSCPGGGETYDETVPVALPQTEGTYEIAARSCDLAGNCAADSVHVTVSLPPPASITGMDPAVPRQDVVLREDPREVLDGTRTMTLHGSFHDRTAVWLFGGCTVGQFPNYCEFRTELSDSEVSIAPNGSRMTVTVPRDDIPERHLRRTFFWGVYDEIRGHPGDDEWSSSDWAKSPEFGFSRSAPYPDAHGFEFVNRNGDSGAGPFQGTYGKVAFGCLPRTDACVPRPLYFTVWLPVYRQWLDKSGGSCVGMASTSQLLYHNDERFRMIGQPKELEPESLDPDAYYAAGIQGVGPFEREPPKPSRYGDYPRRPRNTMGVVRSNHGVQTSMEFLEHVVRGSGGAVETSPRAVLDDVRADPTGSVLCMREGSGGHCVTPYAVDDVDATTSRILVYDNNFPQDATPMDDDGDGNVDRWGDVGPRYVEIDTAEGRWHFPRSASTDPSNPNYAEWNGSGGTIYLVPLSVWEGKRHAPVDLLSVGTEFRTVVRSLDFVFGEADPLYATPDGGRWGWERDGTFVDEMPGATAAPPLGQPSPDNREVPLFLPADAGEPKVQVNVRGEEYSVHSSRPGLALQLSVAGGTPGETDVVAMGHRDGRVVSARFAPDSDREVVAQLGEQYAESEEAVLTLSGLSVEGGGAVEVGALDGERGLRFENDAGHRTRHYLVVRSLDATGDRPTNATVVFGPFDVPDGATQTVTLADWSNTSQVRSSVDTDRDGIVDESRVVSGRQCAAPIGAPDEDGNGIPDACEPGGLLARYLPDLPTWLLLPAVAALAALVAAAAFLGRR